MKKSKIEEGFTLVEILVVMIVLISVGAIIGSIVMSVLRGTNKTNTLTMVRQNGSFAISQISKMLRNAKRLDGVKEAGGSFVETCDLNKKYEEIKITSFDEGQTTFSCFGNELSSESANPVIDAKLLDTDNAVAIEADSCFFTCSQSGISDYPNIGINFSLREKSTGILLPERKASESAIPFNTTVILRNVGR